MDRKLDTADWILMAGHLAGAISIFLISAASIWKIKGSLPETPVFTPSRPGTTQQKGYFDT